jgi:signal transduction histidine kinase
VIEDNRRHAELISDELQESGLGVTVDWAATGQAGFERLATSPVDLILLDYRLPDIDGIEFMRRLRARGFTTPVVIVTTADSVELAVEAMKLGAEDFVQKQEGYLDLLPLVVREAVERQMLRRENVRLEHQLREAERLASLGILASGLAHNINNRLTSLKTFFDLLPHRINDPSFCGEFLQTCREDLDKIALLVQELTRYAFSGTRPRPPEPLADLIQRALRYLDDHVQRKQLQVETTFADLPPIPLDVEGMKQLFINLLKNAIQASPVGGQIRVEVVVEGVPEDVVVRIEDQGPGLPPDVRDKIFDPFFTTKETGLGIGLYICQKIVALHGGRIDAESRPSGGAVFTVRLPVERPEETLDTAALVATPG